MSGRNTRLSVAYEDDPRVVEEQRAEDYAQHMVPLSARVPRGKVLMSNWALLSAAVWLFYGALVAGLVGTRHAVIGMVATVAVYTVLNSRMAVWGVRTGLNSTLLSRRMFGTYGSVLTALLLAANCTYYAVLESSVLAEAFRIHIGALDIRWWYLIVVVTALPLMLGSVQTWMNRVSACLLPLYVIGVIAAVIAAAVQQDGPSDWLAFEGALPAADHPVPGWLMAFCLFLGGWGQMPITVDFARLARPDDLRFHQRVTFGWVFFTWLFLLNGLAGIFLVRTVLPADPGAEVGVVQAVISTLGVWGLLLIVVTQTRVNTLNYYVSSINWGRVASRVLGVRLPRTVWVLSVAAAAFLLMLTDVLGYLQKALTLQGVFLVSWVGIVVTHFALCPDERRTGPEFRPGRLRAFTPGLGVWILAAAVGIWLTETGSAPAVLTQLAPLVSLAISVLFYAIVLKAGPSSLLRRAEGEDPRDEVGDPAAARITCHVCDRAYVAVEMDRDPAASGAAICAACGESNGAFLRAVRAGAGPEPTPSEVPTEVVNR